MSPASFHSANKGVFFLGNRRVEVRPLQITDPCEDEVRLRVVATGICGSDLHVYRGTRPSEHSAGHETAGLVEAVGSAVRFLKAGDRVAVHHHVASSGYACACGDFVFCPQDQIIGVHRPGSFSHWINVPERNCVPLPPSVSFEDGVFLSCVGSTAYAALRRLDVRAQETIAIFGLGPVGLSGVRLAKAMGLRVIGLDVAPARIEQAKQCGADQVVNSNQTDPVAAVRRFARSVWDRKPPHPGFVDAVEGVHYALETSGFAAAQQCLVPCLRLYGKAAIVGVGNGARVINPEDLAWKANTIFGSLVFPIAWAWDLAEFLACSGVSFAPSITHRYRLDQADEAFTVADTAAGGKVLINPDASHENHS